MVIQKMNNVLVKHSKILFGFFTAIIIVSFVWFFTPGVDGSLLFGGRASENTVYGKVFDDNITYGDVRSAMRQISMVLPVTYGGYPGQDIPEEYAFVFAAEVRAASKMNCQVSDAELRSFIQSQPMFRDGEAFSVAKYQEYVDKYLVPMGYGKKDFEDALRSFYLTQVKVPALMSSNVSLSDAEFQTAAKSLLEKFTFRTIVFNPAPFLDSVTVTEPELTALYESNPGQFLPPPESDAIAAVAPFADFKTVVSPETIKAYYDANLDKFKDEAGKVKAFDTVKADIQKQLTADGSLAASKVVDGFYKTLRKLAQDPESKYKENPSAVFRAEAAKLGLKVVELRGLSANDAQSAVGKTLIVEPVAVQALLALKNPGSVTNRVKGSKAAYLSLLTARREFSESTFADRRAVVEKALRLKKAKEQVGKAAESFRAAVKASAKPAADLEKLAVEAKGKVIASPAPQPRYLLEQRPDKQFIFETKAGELSASVRQDGFELMLFMDARTPASDSEIAETGTFLRAYILEDKKNTIRQEYAAYVQSNCRILKPRDENRPPVAD